MKQIFKNDLDDFFELLKNSDSLALARHADGEANILQNNTIGNKDGWLYKRDKNLSFRKDLRKSLKCYDPNFYYGISCSCCDRKNHEYLLDELDAPSANLTFSNIFVNANHSTFQEKFPALLNTLNKDIIFCTGKKAKLKNLNKIFHVSDSLLIPGNCVTWWEQHRDYSLGLLDLKATQFNNAVFLFAAGPLSGILIHELWSINPSNIYIDIGSSFDPIIFNRKSRCYHTLEHELSSRVCKW